MKKNTKVIHIGNVAVGGNNPVRVQSMTKTDTKNIKATVKQVRELTKIGCEIIRSAVPDTDSANALKEIIRQIEIPLIADIHFDWRLAVKSIENGAHGIRINPGNIGGKKGLLEISKIAKERNIPIRIGVNSGSFTSNSTSASLVNTALEYIKILEDMGITELKISIKAPDIIRTIESYRSISGKTNYPLHIGVTEAGPLIESTVKSSIALSTLLSEGIGDTMRISITGRPHEEILVAKQILQSLNLRGFGPEIISCPTCGRCKVNLIKIVNELKNKLSAIRYPLSAIKIAVMGCVVNGPGEAKDADIGIACSNKKAVLFKKGKIIKTIAEKEIVNTLVKQLQTSNIQPLNKS